MSTIRLRKARSGRPRRRVTSMAARIRADREHYEALMADARSDLECLSIYLDNVKDVANLENREWREALAMLEG